MEPSGSQYVTVREAAEILKVSETSVYRAIKAGELPVQRIRRLLRIPKSAVLPTRGGGQHTTTT